MNSIVFWSRKICNCWRILSLIWLFWGNWMDSFSSNSYICDNVNSSGSWSIHFITAKSQPLRSAFWLRKNRLDCHFFRTVSGSIMRESSIKNIFPLSGKGARLMEHIMWFGRFLMPLFLGIIISGVMKCLGTSTNCRME